MLDDESEFITLTPAKAINGIRYIQACRIPKGIDVELGLEKDGRIKLVQKTYDEDGARQFFRDFFNGNVTVDTTGFSLMSFRR